MGAVCNDELEPIVDLIVSLSLSDVVSVIQDPTKLRPRAGKQTALLAVTCPAPSQDPRLLDPVASVVIASTP